MKAVLLMGLLALTLSAQAQTRHESAGLLPTPVARPLLEQDPSVAAARAALEAARQEAGILENSPHEWNAKMSGHRRAIEAGPHYREWTVGLERTLRLPGKAAADRKLGVATVAEAEARYGEALHEAARELLSLWLERLGAERSLALAGSNLQAAQDNLAVVNKRVRAGDAAKLDASLAQAELAEQKRLENEARMQASVAAAHLQARFPGVTEHLAALPEAFPLRESPAFWRERILAESDELKTAQALQEKAQAHAERASAEKTPDPTVGVYTGADAGGRERISGFTISIPLAGGQRSRRADKAVQLAEMSRHEVAQKRRQLEGEISGNVATAHGTFTSLQIAEQGAAAMQDNARLLQRAYALGEADLQSLLVARRQATGAAQNALAARVASLKAYYRLLVDAHLVWDLEHD